MYHKEQTVKYGKVSNEGRTSKKKFSFKRFSGISGPPEKIFNTPGANRWFNVVAEVLVLQESKKNCEERAINAWSGVILKVMTL